MFRATFEKPEPSYAQYYYQTPYCSRTQAHRRGWLRPSKIGRCAGVLLGPFLFSKPLYFPSLLTTQLKQAADQRIRSEP
jgi:hypothetical protein